MAGDELSVGMALYAEQTGGPWATVALLPLNMAGTQGPPSGMGIPPGRNPFTRLRDAALRAAVPLISARCASRSRRLETTSGCRPRSSLSTGWSSPRGWSLPPASPRSTTSAPIARRPLHFVGELRGSPAAARLPAWWGDLDGRRVVHVTQGTQNIDPSDLIRPALEALADRDVLVVVATGVAGRDELPFPVPANARVGGFLPYADLLPRTDVVITNGGWGGVLAALSHGIPLIIAGGDLDKPEIAARVAWAGAGVNLRPAHRRGEGRGGLRSGDVRDVVPGCRGSCGHATAAHGGAPRAAELLGEPGLRSAERQAGSERRGHGARPGLTLGTRVKSWSGIRRPWQRGSSTPILSKEDA